MEDNQRLVSYNYFLFEERLKRNLTKGKFAKKLKIRKLRYSFIENGYFKPNKREIRKISDFFQIDYSKYLEGISSYPKGIDNDKKSKPILLLYKMVATKIFKIINIIFILLSLLSIFLCFSFSNNITKNSRDYLSENYLLLFDEIEDKGSPTYSIVSQDIQRPEIFKSDITNKKYISILGSYTKKDTLNVSYMYSQASEEEKIIFNANMKSSLSDKFSFNVKYIDYITYKSYTLSYYYDINNDKFVLSSDYLKEEIGQEKFALITSKIEDIFLGISEEYESLIKESIGIDIDFKKDLIIDVMNSRVLILKYIIFSFVGGLFSICLSLALIYLLIYSFLYGNKEKNITILRNSTTYSDLTINQIGTKNEIKKDIRIFPIIPESLLKIIGIFLVGAGSIKILILFLKYIGAFPDSPIIQSASYELDIWFNVGLFLIFFINFDIFKDDRRSIRNVFLYFLVFLGLYIIELIIITTVNKYAVGQLVLEQTTATLPNYFGTICCYFLIMLFLFNNPKWANTKKRLLLFRLMSLIPIFIIVLTTTLNYSSKINNWDLPLWVRYLINTGRPQISILCILYLISLYFLRVFFKMKYGTEACKTLFNGNKFLFIKNILMTGLIVIISLFEFILKNNALAHKFDLGLYQNFILLAPLMLLYHPHFGSRNKASDYFILGLYILLYGIGYIFIGLFVVLLFL